MAYFSVLIFKKISMPKTFNCRDSYEEIITYFRKIKMAAVRDKEMAHSIQSPAVEVFSLPPPKKTNWTVVPLSASSGSFIRPLMFSPSLTPLFPLHTHPRHLKQGFWSSPIEALQSKSSKKVGEGKKRRLLDFLQSEPSPYLWRP